MSTEVTKMTTAGANFSVNSMNMEKHLGLGDETAENSISIFSADYKKYVFFQHRNSPI